MQDLLKHFHELSLHPKNAKELKGLILQLAIKGKLSAEWRAKNPERVSGENSAENLLKEIKVEKAKLIKEKKIKKEKDLPKIEKDEILFQLPKSWAWCRLGNFTHNFGQKKPDSDFEYIDVASIDNHVGEISKNLNIIAPNEAPSRARKIIHEGCVLYSTVRPYLLNIATVDRKFEMEVIASTAFSVLNPFLGNSHRYLYFVLRSPYFIDYVENTMKGVAYPAINDSDLKKGLIPIPPVEEQKVIVKTVETLFKEVEAIENLTGKRIELKKKYATSALSQLIKNNLKTQWQALEPQFHNFFNEVDNIKKLTETILQLAVQGKLTAKWRAQNPVLISGENSAKNLLKGIKAEKEKLVKEKKIKKEKALPPVTEDETPYELPVGWVWCRLGDTGYTQTGSTPPKNNSDYYGDYIPFIGPADITNYGMKYPSEGLSEKGLEKGRLIPKNSVMMVCIGGSIGKCYVNSIDVSCNQQINTITTVSSPIKLIQFVCQSKYFQKKVFSQSSGSATPIINKGKWEKIAIPFPPIEEQKVIVKKINVLMELCDKLEKEVQSGQQQIEDLMQSVLKEVCN